MDTPWDSIFTDQKFCTTIAPRRFVQRQMKDCPPESGPVLDLGCGYGRHLIYFAGQGYDVYGLDISPIALLETRRNLEAHHLIARLAQANMWEIPFRAINFAAVLCVNVINHGTPAQIEKCVAGVADCLKPSGLFVLTTLTPNDFKASGEQLGPNTFVCDRGPEKGVLHTFYDLDSAKSLLSPWFTVERAETVRFKQKHEETEELQHEFIWLQANLKNNISSTSN